MNRRYILLFIGVVVLVLLFAGFIFFQQTQTPTSSSVSSISPSPLGNTSALQKTTQTRSTIPTVILAPVANTPKEATRQFYTYYFGSQTNPLADGAYNTNPYLSQNFKDELKAFYNNGNAPVFCLKNKRVNIEVGKEQDVFYDNQYLKEEIISDSTGSQDLYRVVLQQNDGTWLIYDVTCVY